MSAPHTCDHLGICQGRAIPCLNCTHPDAPEWPPANDATDTASPFELMWAWVIALGLALAAVVGMALLAGLIVFLLANWW